MSSCLIFLFFFFSTCLCPLLKICQRLPFAQVRDEIFKPLPELTEFYFPTKVVCNWSRPLQRTAAPVNLTKDTKIKVYLPIVKQNHSPTQCYQIVH